MENIMPNNSTSRQPERQAIRSAWPSFLVGKPLSDKRIAYYQKKGYYANGLRLPPVRKTRARRKDVNEGIFD